jgi:DnaK suppressor protein
MTEHLDDDTLADLREELERRRAELSSNSKRALDDIREGNEGGGGDSVDESTEEQGRSTMLRLKDRERKLLTKVNRALEMLESDEYGYCVECEEPIPEKRLRARPVTLYCIDCKEERERAEERRKKRPGLMDDFQM